MGFSPGGGASSDGEVVEYLANNLLSDLNLGDLLAGIFGCSTIAVQSPEGDALFGRNFDWENCEAMVVESHPENGYASLSTVNMDFITQNVGGGMVGLALNLDEVKTLAALYAPLDGINEAGLAVSVNMIQDSAAIEQNTDKPDITTTTAIRLLLDQAGNVDEALELLGQYDLHGSMGMMVHFAIAWYCENVTFENCKIIGTQPLCYCKGLKLVGCEMIDCDLAFERSEVEATITTPVLSIKNPLAGSRIMVPAVGEIIRDMKEGTGTVQVQGQEPESVSACA